MRDESRYRRYPSMNAFSLDLTPDMMSWISEESLFIGRDFFMRMEHDMP